MKPFTEHALFELGNESVTFFATGSRVSLGEDGSFATPLRNKEQIRFSFNVKNGVKMPSLSSSIYYFNVVDGQWQIPSNATKDLTGPFGNFSFPTDWGMPSGSVNPFETWGSLFTEDTKGFTAYGSPVASGSASPFVQSVSEYSHINDSLNDYGLTSNAFNSSKISESSVKIMTRDYTKSVQRSSTYEPAKKESFVVGNAYPFLIEKAVIEIPFSFGKNWYDDRTATCSGAWRNSRFSTSYIQAATGSFASNRLENWEFYDRGGPVLTVALFSQKGYGSGSILDLIATGTITHEEDVLSVSVKDVPADIAPYRSFPAYPRGVLSFTSLGLENPSVYVPRNSNSSFTGSIAVKMESGVSNGIDTIFRISTSWTNTTAGRDAAKTYYANLMSKRSFIGDDPQISFQTYKFLPTDVDPYGRGMSGFSPSGGSIFGYEYNSKGFALSVNNFVNPYYVQDDSKRNELISYVDTYIDNYWTTYSQTPTVYMTSRYSFSSNRPSPYLLNPGEKLILAISKTRPAMSGASFVIPDATSADVGMGYVTAVYPLTGSSEGHDVQLITGSINITLYGSYVRNNAEYKP